MITEVRDVSGRHPANREPFLIRLDEPSGEFSDVLKHCFAAVVSKVVAVKELAEQTRFVGSHRYGAKNIIGRILHSLTPRV